VLVPNAIDVPYWAAAGHHDGGHPGLHVVAVGRLAARKRVMDLLRVLRAARGALPAAIGLRATVVGDGPERGRMLRYLAHHRMSGWVHLVGGLSPGGVRDVVADAEVFLAPATLESFGIASLEARAAGVPVPARAGTGIADFVGTNARAFRRTATSWSRASSGSPSTPGCGRRWPCTTSGSGRGATTGPPC
jgi:glycosyltransferase involved in cell wall biosynthesis